MIITIYNNNNQPSQENVFTEKGVRLTESTFLPICTTQFGHRVFWQSWHTFQSCSEYWPSGNGVCPQSKQQ